MLVIHVARLHRAPQCVNRQCSARQCPGALGSASSFSRCSAHSLASSSTRVVGSSMHIARASAYRHGLRIRSAGSAPCAWTHASARSTNAEFALAKVAHPAVIVARTTSPAMQIGRIREWYSPARGRTRQLPDFRIRPTFSAVTVISAARRSRFRPRSRSSRPACPVLAGPRRRPGAVFICHRRVIR